MARILVVDDDDFNIDTLRFILRPAGHEVLDAGNGRDALRMLRDAPGQIDLVLLDWVMPVMTGLSCLNEMKADPALADIPVVMQTAMTDPANVAEGISAGAYYYLTKPLQGELVRAIVDAALSETIARTEIKEALGSLTTSLQKLPKGTIELRTLDDVFASVPMISALFPDPERAASGVYELLLNALEHGNLGISYDEKTELILHGDWKAEILRRQESPDWQGRTIRIAYEHTETAFEMTITDDGDGFEFEKYLEFDPERAFDVHGRGIALSKGGSFDTLGYRGRGNEVRVTMGLSSPAGSNGEEEDAVATESARTNR